MPSPPAKGLEVFQEGDSLITSSGATLLRSLAPEASVSPDGAGAVVALASRAGPTARFDVARGEVSSPCLSHTLLAVPPPPLRAAPRAAPFPSRPACRPPPSPPPCALLCPQLAPGTRFLALGRTSLWWMTPAWGASAAELPVETQFLLVEVDPGREYALLLPLIDGGAFRATLRPAGGNWVGLCVESGSPEVTAAAWGGALYAAAGADPFTLLRRGVAAAAARSGGARARADKAVPPSADVFGWCTWDAFYSRVCASGVLQGVASLAEGGAPPRLLILDDGWQMTDVDEQYRYRNGSPPAPAPADAGPAATPEARRGPSSQLELQVGAAEHAVEAAAAEMLAGPGDEAPAQVAGENALAEEEAAAALAAAQAAAAAAAQAAAAASLSPLGRLAAAVAAWAVAVRQGARLAVATAEASALRLGAVVLDSATSGSLIVRLFTWISTGPLRATLLRFYAHSSDHMRRLTSVRANGKFAAPGAGAGAALSSAGGDLGAVVAALKERHGVRFVYAWHAMGGFWGGLDELDPGVAAYAPTMLRPVPTPSMLEADPAVAWVQPVLGGVCLPLDPTALHRDMHAYLAGCGVDGVKVDVQGTIGLAGSGAGGGGGAALAAAYHASLEASAAAHFPGNHLINCMAHSTENIYRWRDSNLARVSDDFYPLRPASHTSHIGNCAFNSLFMGEIVIPDW